MGPPVTTDRVNSAANNSITTIANDQITAATNGRFTIVTIDQIAMQSQPAESLQYQTTQLPVANDRVITLTTDRVTNDPVTTSNAADDLVTSHN